MFIRRREADQTRERRAFAELLAVGAALGVIVTGHLIDNGLSESGPTRERIAQESETSSIPVPTTILAISHELDTVWDAVEAYAGKNHMQTRDVVRLAYDWSPNLNGNDLPDVGEQFVLPINPNDKPPNE